ncbi:MAG: acetylglutamate kinase [Elusimicrobia bacterium RIFCSPLOWO2_01_FULL_54_10]|nr:MAG: acetylglutamate kinase [Elusimicrobia bacterium RIFCSPLOWO2_01_FULL_54_10]
MSRPLTVIKIGGSLLEKGNFEPLVRALVPFLKKNKAILVHGGGKEVTALGDQLKVESRFVNGRRFTDDKMMAIVEMVLSGKVNPFLVGRLNSMKIPALGLSGRDGDIVRAKKVPGLGRVGLPSAVNKLAIMRILKSGDVPVFSSIASDGKGGALNVNADEMACALAMALKAARLILYTDVPGILDGSKKTIPRITEKSANDLIRRSVISGGMIPKVRSALQALKKGVREVQILEGKLPLNKAKGTTLVRN